MARNDALEWMEIAAGTLTLALESAAVVALRASRAAQGGRNASDEAVRMYSEKFAALAELQLGLITGSLGATPAATARGTLSHYRRKVRANRRRLSGR